MENTEELNLEVAEILNNEKASEAMEEVKELIHSDPEAMAMMEKAETVEDMYTVFKKFISVPLEAFKTLFHSVADYFKNDKVELSDETMDAVVGGWSWSVFWKANRERVLMSVALVAVVGLGITGIGAGVGALIGCFATATAATGTGAAIGAAVGGVLGVGGMGAAAIADTVLVD